MSAAVCPILYLACTEAEDGAQNWDNPSFGREASGVNSPLEIPDTEG